MQNALKRMSLLQKAFTIIAGALLIMQIVAIAYINFRWNRECLDGDAARAMFKVMEMWRNKTILLPNFRNYTTHEIDLAIFAVWIYAIIKDIVLAFSISNMMFILFYCIVIWILTKAVDASIGARFLAMALVITPWSFGQLDYFHMMFFGAGYYANKAMVPLFTVTLLVLYQKMGKSNLLWKIFAVVVTIMSLILSISTDAYGLTMCAAPACLWYIFCEIPTFDLKKTFKKASTLLVLAVLCASSIGVVLSGKLGIQSKGGKSEIRWCDDLITGIYDAITGIYLALGLGARNVGRSVPVTSVHGIYYICKYIVGTVILVVILYLIIYVVRFIIKSCSNPPAANGLDYLTGYMGAVVIMNLIVLLLQVFLYPRYMFSMILMTIIIGVCLLDRFFRNSGMNKVSFIVASAFLGVTCFASLFSLYDIKSDSDFTNRVREYNDLAASWDMIKDYDDEYILVFESDNKAAIMRLLSYGTDKKSYMLNGTDVDFEADYYLPYYGLESDIRPYCLILDNSKCNFEDVDESVRKSATLIGSSNQLDVYRVE